MALWQLVLWGVAGVCLSLRLVGNCRRRLDSPASPSSFTTSTTPSTSQTSRSATG